MTEVLRAYVDWIWRRHAWVLAAAALLASGAALLTARLELRTNFAELLPSRDPALVELEHLARRVGGTAVLQVVLESPDREANLRFAGTIADALQRLGPGVVESVTYDVRAEQAFFRERRWLYAPLAELERLRDALRGEIARRKNPLLVELDEEDSPRLLAKRLRERAEAAGLGRFPTGFFEGEGGRLVVLVCRPPGGLFAERAGETLVTAVRRVIVDAHFPPGIRVRLTGDVMAQIEERQALESDLLFATCVCVALVGLVVVLFFGRLGALPQVGAPALLGVLVAFGAAKLGFGYLNASTAFMGSIVVGNGINFPIIALARYHEERRAGHAARAACERALAATLRPTLVASFGAAIAYGSLLSTRFRGFSQFGAIGAIGMLAAWSATMTLLPATWAAFDRRAAASTVSRQPSFAGGVARLAARSPRGCLLLFALISLLASIPLGRTLRDPFEYDFRNLRNRRSIEQGAESIAPRVDRLFGLTLTPAVVLADTRAHAREVRERILARDRAGSGRPLIGDVTTLDTFLPGDPALQRKKLALLAELRALVDSPEMKQLGVEDQRAMLAERPPDSLRAIEEGDLPDRIRRPFTESDGTLGRVVLVYHGEWVSVWDGKNLMRISDLIERVPLADGTVVRSSGHAVIFSSMIRSIAHDAPRAALWSLLGVALLVRLVVRERGAAWVLLSLLAGVLWMLGAAAWLGVRANFLNFIALPITFGIGVDYGINILWRVRLEGTDETAIVRAVRSTGGAVALASLTTIIGYGSLLVADNLALRSFGTMAILGEVACLSAALLGLPAFLIWRARGRS